MSTTTSLVRAVFRCAERHGVPPSDLARRSGLDLGVVDDLDARLPTPTYLMLIANAVAMVKNDALGPEIARFIDGASFGLVGFVVASCASLGDALRHLARYSRLLCDELSVEIVARGDSVHVVYGMDAEPHVPAFFEMALVHLAVTARRGTRGAFAPARLTFRHHAPVRAWPRALGLTAKWREREDSLVCDRAALDLRLRGANTTLLQILDAHAAHVLGQLPPRDDLIHQSRAAVRSLISRTDLSIDAVARRLGVGPRTLQRRLRERGLTFRDLLDEVRRDCALIQLDHPDTRVADVAFALGFSSTSAFHHAFRRWTGRAPTDRD